MRGGIEIGALEKYRVSFQKCVDWRWKEFKKEDHLPFFVACKISGKDLCKKEV